MMQDKESTDNTWTLEKARAFAQEKLKMFPSVKKTGGVIIPVRKSYLSAKQKEQKNSNK